MHSDEKKTLKRHTYYIFESFIANMAYYIDAVKASFTIWLDIIVKVKQSIWR